MLDKFKVNCLILVSVFSPFAAFAGNFAGKVLDEAGLPLAGATVSILDCDREMISDAEGCFVFDADGLDRVRIRVSFVGFITETVIMDASDGSIGQPDIVTLKPEPAELGEIVVTATRTPKTLKDVPVVTRLLTVENIKKADASNIQDLLMEELPGLEFGFTMGNETSLSMGGFGGNAVLFLVDGERLAGETMDNVDYNRLNLDDVGQVEIVRGASSAVYGANAVGGVVNLVSRENKEPWHVHVSSRYRSAGNEWRIGGKAGFNTPKWNSNTSVQYTSSQTIRLTDAFDTESKIHAVYGGSVLNVKERLVFRAADGLQFIARGGYFRRMSNRANYDDMYHDYGGGLRALWQIGRDQNLEFSYSYDQYDKARFVGGRHTDDHDYSNRRHMVHGLYNLTSGRNVLTVGADYMFDFLATYQFVSGTNHSQHSFDAFVQFDYNPLEWLNVVASLRDDYFSASDNNALTARLATMFKFRPISVRASYSGGFRAPSLKEMYMSFDMAGIQMIYGNPDLKPERSHNANLALEHNGRISDRIFRGAYSVTVAGYYNYYNSRITTTDFPGDDSREPGAIYCNEAGVQVAGLDFSARYRMKMGLGISLNYNFLHTMGRKFDSQFSQPRPHSATWRLDYDRRFGKYYKLYVALSGRFLSKPDSRLPSDGAYSLWKFTLQQQVWRGVDINFVVDNIFNYRPKIYYWNSAPTTGISLVAGVSLNIEEMFGKL